MKLLTAFIFSVSLLFSSASFSQSPGAHCSNLMAYYLSLQGWLIANCTNPPGSLWQIQACIAHIGLFNAVAQQLQNDCGITFGAVKNEDDFLLV